MRRCRIALLAVTALLFAARAAVAQSDRDGELEHQGLTRRYELHLPSGSPDTGPRPVFVVVGDADQKQLASIVIDRNRPQKQI